ncbi:MAG: SDR family oxidoreductase [Anaerolineae bacterium]
MKSVVVTGVSTGIGWGILKVLTQHGIHVFGSVRKREDAERLTAEFGELYTPLVFDVTNEQAVKTAAELVRERMGGITLLGLVNNAGIGIGGPLMHQPISDFRKVLEVNLVGALIVSQAFIPLLGADKSLRGEPGRIVNISSVGGKVGGPFLGAYAASKHGLEGMSESLRRELMLYGIDVIIVGPGAVATPIWDKAESQDVSQIANTDYAPFAQRFMRGFIAGGRKGFPPEKIGEVVYKALTTAKPRVRYPVVPGFVMNWLLPTLLPKRMIDNVIANQLGMKRK